MNENDYLKTLTDDTCLREALSRSVQKQPPLPSDLNERLMQRLDRQQKPPRRIWPLALTALGIAASVLLVLMLRPAKEQPKQQPVVAAQPQEPTPQPAVPAEPIQPSQPHKPIHPTKPKRPSEAELPDTLGESIFKSEENVRIAMQILRECKATIRREEQQTRNDIIEATFNALPHAEDALLVRGESGDLEVIQVSRQTAIEI